MNLKKYLIVFGIFLFAVKISSAQVSIGIALPLMRNSENADEKRLGAHMLRGIEDAFRNYDSLSPAIKVKLKIEDTNKDKETALEIFNRLGSDTSFIAILGPVFSSELASNAGAAAFHKIPIITPTATQNFLAKNNDYVFQLNPTYDIRGRLMAKFAMKELGMKNFVILSEENYGKNFAESFADEVTENNGKIAITKYYVSGQGIEDQLIELKREIYSNDKFIDFSNLTKQQIEKLKGLRFSFSNLDSLASEKLIVSIYKLFGKGADSILSNTGIIPEVFTDKSDRYIPGIADAVYVPIVSADEISIIAKAFPDKNINLQLIGNSDWNNPELIEENGKSIKNLYFDADFYLESDELLQGKSVETDMRNYYLGYDAMKLILDEIAKGNSTRESLNNALQNLSDYKANHNNITLLQRTNHELSVMRFYDGKLQKIKNFKY